MQKTIEDFNKIGFNRKGWAKKYYQKNKEHIKNYRINYYSKNRERIIKRTVEYNKKHPEIQRKYRNSHKEQIKERYQEYRQRNKEYVNNHGKKYYHENKNLPEYKMRRKIQKKKYHQKHRKHIIETTRTWLEEHPDYQKKYYETNKEHIKKRSGVWKKTESGKQSAIKNVNKRRREKRFIQILPNIFPIDIPVDWHHIDGKLFVAPLPKVLHQKVNGHRFREHIKYANDWIEFYYNISPMDILQENILCVDVQIVEDGLKTKEQ